MIIVLTATIRPNAIGRLELSDPSVRAGQYRSALHWWLRAPRRELPVLLVENSGAELSFLTAGLTPAERSRLELVSIEPPVDDIAARGKGATEAIMLERVLGEEVCSGHDWVIKATGRLRVRNIDGCLSGLEDHARALCLRTTVDLTYADSRFFAVTPEAWARDFGRIHVDVNESAGRYLEHALAGRAAAMLATGESKVVRFKQRPHIYGASGTTGKKYGGWRSFAAGAAAAPVEALLRGVLSKKQY